MNWRQAGRNAVLIECDSQAQVHALYRRVQALPPEGIEDCVPAARTLLLIGAAAAELAGKLVQHAPAEQPPGTAAPLELPVRYDGEDLAVVAELTGLSIAAVIDAHRGAIWTVAFCGFAPGFAYLDGGPAILHVPRRDSPRVRVPAGAVGLAGEYTGIYPRSSPGGWQLIGRTSALLWDLRRSQPALLQAGQRVRFVEMAQ